MTALEGLKIIDFSRFLPGAYPSWIAADMGAEVIRIEHPRELAKQKAMFGDKGGRDRARPTYHRNKRSLLINPGSPAALPVLEKLIATADVLIEDYRPGIMDKMHLGAERLQALNPELVYLSVSFAGQTGPLAGQAGHDPLALSLAGALSRLNGLPTPSLPGLQVADVMAGAHATIAMLLALQAREKTGRGQHVDVAMSDSAMPLLLVGMGRTDDMDRLPPLGQWHPKGGVWECQDGRFLCTTDMEPAYWGRFCAAMDRPQYAALQHDAARHPEIRADLANLFLTRPRDEWTALLADADTQAMPVYSPNEALSHPHNQARGMVQDVPDPSGGEPLRQLGLPFTFSDTQPIPPVAAGMPGADNAAILAGLGFDSAQLEAAGAFSAERSAR